MRRGLGAYAPALLWAGVVAYVNGLSDIPGPTTDLPIDKLAHFSFYAILGALAARGWQRSGRSVGWWLPILAMLLLGGWDEWRQRAIVGRTADVADWVADAAGIVVGFLIMMTRMGKARRRGGDES